MTNKNDKIHIKIGMKIMLERKKRGLSQEKLAELSDLSKTYVGDVERGTSVPTINTLDLIAKALGMELKDLVDVSKVDL